MNITVEEQDNRLIVSPGEQNHTLMTLLKHAVNEEGGTAGYDKGHPYTGGAKLIVTGDNPDDVLESAIERAREQLDDFEDAFDSA